MLPLLVWLAHPVLASEPRPVDRPPVATADSRPMARIRGASRAAGLTPMDFALWLNRQPQAWASTATMGLRRASSPAALLNLTSELFGMSDSDHNGRISAEELADFVARNGSSTILEDLRRLASFETTGEPCPGESG